MWHKKTAQCDKKTTQKWQENYTMWRKKTAPCETEKEHNVAHEKHNVIFSAHCFLAIVPYVGTSQYSEIRECIFSYSNEHDTNEERSSLHGVYNIDLVNEWNSL